MLSGTASIFRVVDLVKHGIKWLESKEDTTGKAVPLHFIMVYGENIDPFILNLGTRLR
jgi:hypothetical protein